MQYISSDTNVWIDFVTIQKTEIPFRLPYTYIMSKDAVEDELLQKASALISRDISAHFGPSQVAESIGMPLRKLNAKAKHELGHSVLDEIIRLRIEEAKHLMLASDDKLSAIAATTGFCNASYFSKVFHRQTGATPRAWRRQHGH